LLLKWLITSSHKPSSCATDWAVSHWPVAAWAWI